MLKLYKPQFIERVITSPTGERFIVVFQVTYLDGKATARVVSARLIDETVDAEVLCLPCVNNIIESDTEYVPSFTPVVSPFTSLLFFTSQPTRAPSYKF